MKRILLLLCFLYSISLFGQAPILDWVAQIGGNGEDMGRNIETDQDGNIFVSGTFSDTSDFDPDSTIYYPLISEGSLDIFLAKYTSTGQLVWAYSFGDFNNNTTGGMAIDTFGNVLISGIFGGTVDFDPGADMVSLTASSIFNSFILKLDNDGNFIWVKQFEDFLVIKLS